MKSYCHFEVTPRTTYLKVVIKAPSLDTRSYQQEIAHQTHTERYFDIWRSKCKPIITGLLGSSRNIYQSHQHQTSLRP